MSDTKEIISTGRAFGKTTEILRDLQVENQKLKAENEYLLRQYGDEVSGLCDDKRFKKIIELESEITKLKKSRDVLRKSIEWYEHESNWLYPEIRKDGSRMTKTIFVMREKAREAIKEDDEIMGGIK